MPVSLGRQYRDAVLPSHSGAIRETEPTPEFTSVDVQTRSCVATRLLTADAMRRRKHDEPESPWPVTLASGVFRLNARALVNNIFQVELSAVPVTLLSHSGQYLQ